MGGGGATVCGLDSPRGTVGRGGAEACGLDSPRGTVGSGEGWSQGLWVGLTEGHCGKWGGVEPRPVGWTHRGALWEGVEPRPVGWTHRGALWEGVEPRLVGWTHPGSLCVEARATRERCSCAEDAPAVPEPSVLTVRTTASTR